MIPKTIKGKFEYLTSKAKNKTFNETDLAILLELMSDYKYKRYKRYIRALFTVLSECGNLYDTLIYLQQDTSINLRWIYRTLDTYSKKIVFNDYVKFIFHKDFDLLKINNNQFSNSLCLTLLNTSITNFDKLIQYAVFNHCNHIDNEAYSYLKFDTYKTNFTHLAKILLAHKQHNFLSKQDVTKHTNQLLKVAYYKNVPDYYISNIINEFYGTRIYEGLKSALFTKKIQKNY